MKLIQFLQATNVISRHRQCIQQDLTFAMVVENIAYDKTVEVQWAGEDKVWHTLRAEFLTACDANREIWCARTSVVASDHASLPGDIEFVLHCRIRGQEVWDNNGSHNYFSSADSGVLLQNDVPLLDIDFNPLLAPDQRYYPITVAVRHSVQPEHVFVQIPPHQWPLRRDTQHLFLLGRERACRELAGNAREQLIRDGGRSEEFDDGSCAPLGADDDQRRTGELSFDKLPGVG